MKKTEGSRLHSSLHVKNEGDPFVFLTILSQIVLCSDDKIVRDSVFLCICFANRMKNQLPNILPVQPTISFSSNLECRAGLIGADTGRTCEQDL